jgi:glycosyltransferase involved in cell wall biosynthesis
MLAKFKTMIKGGDLMSKILKFMYYLYPLVLVFGLLIQIPLFGKFNNLYNLVFFILILFDFFVRKNTFRLKGIFYELVVFAIFILYMTMTFFWVIDISFSVTYYFSRFIGVFIVFVISIFTNDKKDLNRFLTVFSIAFIINLLIGHFELETGNFILPHEDYLKHRYRHYKYYPIGMFENPNDYAYFVVLGIPFVIYSLFQYKNKAISFALAFLVSFETVYTLYYTLSRIMYLVLCLELFIVLLLFLRRKLYFLLLLACTFIVLLFLFRVVDYQLIVSQLKSIIENDVSVKVRFDLIKFGFQVLKDYHYAGVGTGNSMLLVGNYLPQLGTLSLHSFLLVIFVEYGIFIFTIFIIMIVVVLFKLLIIAMSNKKYFILSCIAISSLFGFMLGSFGSSDSTVLKISWIVMGLWLAVIKLERLDNSQLIHKEEENKQHILLVPSWYVSKDAPLHGSFFKEQAEALKQGGFQVSVAYVDLRSPRKKRQYGIKYANENGIHVYRFNFPFLPIWSPIFLYLNDFFLNVLYNRINHEAGEVEIIHAHSCYPAGISAYRLTKKVKKPLVITEHATGLFTEDIYGYMKKQLTKCVTNADQAIGVSPMLAEAMNKFGAHAKYVPNMIDFSKFKLNKKENEKFTFLSVGHLIHRKGMDTLISAFHLAFKDQNDVELIIAGVGSEETHLKAMVNDLSLNKSIHFIGSVNREKMPKLYNSANCFVLASRLETFGVVFIEALACGIPVIGTVCGGPEIIINESNGFLVAKDHVEALANALKQMFLNHNNFDSEILRLEAEKLYSNEAVVEQLTVIYNQLT